MPFPLSQTNAPFIFNSTIGPVADKPTYVYRVNKTSRFEKIKDILIDIIFFPIGIAKRIHSLVGKIVVPASLSVNKKRCNEIRKKITSDSTWKYTPITLKVDGYAIDAMIIKNENQADNKIGRWVLYSHGNSQLYEDQLNGEIYEIQRILEVTKSHGIVFNSPGIGNSSGSISRSGMKKAYQAALQFLEDQENGAKAKQIIGYGYSIGAGVQAEAIKKHQFQQNIDYVFIKSKAFSTLKKAAAGLVSNKFIGMLLSLLVRITGWNIDTIKSSKMLSVPEIILQTGKYKCQKINDTDSIINDGIISKNAALATSILKKLNKKGKIENQKLKTVISLTETHNQCLEQDTVNIIATFIDEIFKSKTT
ncbi:MAG: hypothetical protein QRY74_03075 [Chlamydia sp.]